MLPAGQRNKSNEAHRRVEDGENRSPLATSRGPNGSPTHASDRVLVLDRCGGRFLPLICPCCVGVQQAQIGDEMLLVVARQMPARRRNVRDRRIERWRLHVVLLRALCLILEHIAILGTHRPTLNKSHSQVRGQLPRVHSLAAFGRRPPRTRHRRSWPASETLRTTRIVSAAEQSCRPDFLRNLGPFPGAH